MKLLGKTTNKFGAKEKLGKKPKNEERAEKKFKKKIGTVKSRGKSFFVSLPFFSHLSLLIFRQKSIARKPKHLFFKTFRIEIYLDSINSNSKN